jgi:hypothetical protein
VKTNRKYPFIAILLTIGLLSFSQIPALGSVRFGPYEALTINSDVIRGVKVDDGNAIWLLLNPAYKEKELIVKLSNEKGAGYRKWENGTYELVSPANQGKQANEWTDWVRTKAKYIEYWMEDSLILHLKKVE